MASNGNEIPEESSQATKRLRWATQRRPGRSGSRKRVSIMDRLHHKGSIGSEKKRESGISTDLGRINEDPNDDAKDEEDTDTVNTVVHAPRKIFFNTPLPAEMVDEDGNPSTHFARNKIRTAKYTPLSFLPKNIWWQFHNIANIYFLVLIILAFFSVFGAANPGLGAVPLIVIVVATAIKDAIEDYRRTVLDNELNNSPIHRLVDWNNVNVSTDDVSAWRRLKKATSHGIAATWRKVTKSKKATGKDFVEPTAGDTRPSFESRPTSRATRRESAFSVANTHRTSYASAREEIQMTPVPSPLPRDDSSGTPAIARPGTSMSYEGGEHGAPAQRDFGSLINHNVEASGKARFHSDYWKNVQVGDFVRLYNNDQIPADIVVLSTSAEDGACYVETKNLDGETNLKVRNALRSGHKVKHARDCERVDFTIESEAPQSNLYQYNGVAKWTQHNPKIPDHPGTQMAEPISINNMLLRGCNVRNTEWVLGVVVFTGMDTKIMINAGVTPSKRSRIARELNWNVIYNFLILLVMCIVSGIVQGIAFGRSNSSKAWFEFGSVGGSPALDGTITFWAALILYQNMVPIALYISVEIIRTLQAFFIYSDTEMYYERLDYPCTPKSWNISDDLGQIEYIFSDKTGTLTQNVMEFKKATINGHPYGEAYTEAMAGLQKRQGVDVVKEAARANKEIAEARVKMVADLRRLHDNPYLRDDELTFVAPTLVSDLSGGAGSEQQQATEQFMLALALCHTVIPETTPGDPPRIDFKAQSPDEAALVATARDLGYTVLGNTNDGIRVNIQGDERHYQILNTLEFNSTRKRMSAIVRMPDNKIILFCKGADSMIYSRLSRGDQQELRRITAEHLEMFAREGLRTLCIAQRELGEDEYQLWNKDYDLAAAAIEDREDKIEAMSDKIERDLTLLGGTAIEDRLQDGVPDTIALLAEAGIKLWVLTGDKVETAINIGFSCNLLNNDMELIVLKITDAQITTADEELDKHLATFNLTGSDEDLAAAINNHEPPAPTHALVIDGDSLSLVLDEQLRQKFLLLCKQCKSVLCCRVSPAQKASVVSMVKKGLDVMTLSIGDGANDVAMIQEADVGVGIAGEEGRQAVMSSDYAIGQFRYLQRLVLVHGRWSYRRLGEMMANFFYKNIIWTFTLFWYQLFCDFDQTYLYDYTYILLFNLAFTSVPVIFMGVLDQDVSDKISLAVPQLYRRGIERKEWTQRKFWLYMLDGLYQSVMCFFVAYLVFRPATGITTSGLNIEDRLRLGLFVAPVTVVVINTYIMLNSYRWDWLMMVLVTVSSLLVFFWSGVFSAFKASAFFYKAAAEVFAQPSFWAVTSIAFTMALLPRFVIKFVQKAYFPYDIDIIREQVRQGKFDYLDKTEESEESKLNGSSNSSDLAVKPSKHSDPSFDEERRPIYPPSVAPTATTHNNRSQNGSDGTDYLRNRQSLEPPIRPSVDRAGPSYDRVRQSMDRIRPSFEQSNDFTSAAMLTRFESSHSFGPVRSRMRDNYSYDTR